MTIINLSYSQITAPEIEWQNTIGGNANDFLYSVQGTSDGGYILGGTSYSHMFGDRTEDHLGVRIIGLLS